MTPRTKVLVVDDDPKTVDLVKLYLQKDGHAVVCAYDGVQALDLARHERPDLIVLDLMLPGMDGLSICRAMRAESSVPIIMLTARTTENDRLAGLDLGADDYVIKPFSPKELAARVRAVLRRTADEWLEGAGPAQISLGDLNIDYRRHEVAVADRPVVLTPTEFRLLGALAREPGRVFSREELIQKAFGHEFDGFDRGIDVHILHLRRKIERDPRHPEYIKTIYGAGYKLGVS